MNGVVTSSVLRAPATNMSTPHVTVLMAVHNGAAYVRESVDSILAQEYPYFELLVIEDGSTDETGEILNAYRDSRLRVIRNPVNLGLTRSLNVGLAAARGELVARQDADDRSHPQRLLRQVRFLEDHPRVALVGAQARRIDARGRVAPLRGWPKSLSGLAIRWQLMLDSPFVHSAVMYRRNIVWHELRGYDEAFRTSQDFELWSRLSVAHELRNLAEALVDFRTTVGSVSTRYVRNDIARMGEVMLRNRSRLLQSERLARCGLQCWLEINNPGTFGRVNGLAELVSADEKIFGRFAELNPDATGNEEIRTHRAISLARAAGNGARQRARGSFRVLTAAYRLKPAIGPFWMLRFAGLSLGGIERAGRVS